jgi:hypothetical protein
MRCVQQESEAARSEAATETARLEALSERLERDESMQVRIVQPPTIRNNEKHFSTSDGQP